ncbi:hypothetical protein [Flavobacterium sp. T12S277]|uniref:hypothetical protein n=1 Tax=Flavobacterium sp. T12S277 TaxID=3402752 RepID=UPI003ADC1C59
MKKITLLLFLFITYSNAQETEIKITPEGISSAVIPTEGKTAVQSYELAKDMILKMFDTPKNVIKVDEQGKILRFEGVKKFKGSISTEGLYNYTCELEFKDGRYKISFYDVYLDKGIKRTFVDLFNKDGDLRKMTFYKTLHSNFTIMLNEVNDMFKNKIVVGNKEDKW